MISTVQMFVFECDLCDNRTGPMYSESIPYGWEVTTFNGKEILLCASHIYGITPKEKEKLERI